jgi:hypothetical protein
MIQDERLYPKELSIQLSEKSITNLSERETDLMTDIKVSPYINKNYRKNKLFNHFNHPTRPILKYLAEKIFSLIGLKEKIISESGIGYLDAIMTPIYKSTYKNLNLNFAEDFTTYNGLRKLSIAQESVVKDFFTFYNSQIKQDLINIIKRTKPFIPKIVEPYI